MCRSVSMTVQRRQDYRDRNQIAVAGVRMRLTTKWQLCVTIETSHVLTVLVVIGLYMVVTVCNSTSINLT